MHTKSSINIKPVSGNSEAHNLRTGKPLSYVRQDRTELNESWTKESVHNARLRIEETYKKEVGQKLQAKATPIREGVINLGKKQDMNTLKDLSKKLEERFGIKTIQIHIHEDEGHHQSKYNKEGKEIKWKQNRHAHMVFDWTDEKGKSLKLNKKDMAEMQTVVAEELGMERGQSSDRKHLNAMEYKLQEMEKDALQLEKDMKKLKATIKAQKYGENIKKGLSESFKAIGGVNAASKLKEELKTLKNDFSELSKNHVLLYNEVERLREREEKAQQAIREKAFIEQQNRELQRDNQQQKERIEKQNKGLKIATENEETWRNNCKKIVTGEISLEKARAFMVENGYLKGKGNNQGFSY